MHLPNPERVVSVGVGGGLELHALRKLYPNLSTQIIGLDLSDKAIEVTRMYCDKHHIVSSLVQGSAIDIPFIEEGNPVDGIIFSSLLHEVYSYVPDGKKAWKQAIISATQNLKEDGILLLRDFAAPFIQGDVQLSFLSNYSQEFYGYFRQRYRTFQFWKHADRNAIKDKRVTEDDYPEISKTDGTVMLPFDKAAELMLHFRNYADHVNKKLIRLCEPTWKEADETYIIPDPNSEILHTMPPDIYVDRVLKTANEALSGSGAEFECISYQVSPRPNTAKFLMLHFRLEKDGVESSVLFDQIPAKMELVFRKTKNANMNTEKSNNKLPDKISAIFNRYPNARLIKIAEYLNYEEFAKQKGKQLEYPIEGAAMGIVILSDGKIVLTKRTGAHSGWALPGGRVELQEDFDTAFVREVFEETGVEVSIDDAISIEDKTFISPSDQHLQLWLAIFRSHTLGNIPPHQTAEAVREGLEVASFMPDDLPEDMLNDDRRKINDFFHAIL